MVISIFHIRLIFPEVNIPVIVVFTKYDILFNEHYRDCLRDKLSPTNIRVEAANRANRAFIEYTKELEEKKKFPFVPVQVATQKDKRKNATQKDTQKQREEEGLLITSVISLFPFKWSLMQELCSWN
jgi:hypothetical protein